MYRLKNRLLPLFLLTCMLLVPVPVEADDISLGLKAWHASFDADNLNGGNDLFPGATISWHINKVLWISASYLEGEVDFGIANASSLIQGSTEEVDGDFVMGWSLNAFDVGVGYRFAKFTSTILGSAIEVDSGGPMLYVGDSASWGKSPWGYYWGGSYMFEDLEDKDGSQTHFNIEAGISRTSEIGFAVLLGYRYKSYSGDGVDGASYDGPVVNLVFKL